MKKGLMALVLALAMAVPLTACGSRDNGGMTNNNTGAGENSGSVAGGSDAGTGGNSGTTAGQEGRYVGPNAAGGSTGSDMNGAYSGSNPQRSAPGPEDNAYLRDGRYWADGMGQVDGRDSSGTRDLTRDARDMVKGAGDALMDMGRDVRDAVGDLGSSMKDAMGGQ